MHAHKSSYKLWPGSNWNESCIIMGRGTVVLNISLFSIWHRNSCKAVGLCQRCHFLTKGWGDQRPWENEIAKQLVGIFSQFSRDLTIYVMWKHDDFLKNLLGIWQYIKMKIRWEVLIDFMDWPHESIDRRPISHDFHISPRSSPPGINQTNDNQDIDTISLKFPLLFFNKSCWRTVYLKVMHLNYGVNGWLDHRCFKHSKE